MVLDHYYANYSQLCPINIIQLNFKETSMNVGPREKFVSKTVMLFKYYAYIKFSLRLSKNGAKLYLKVFYSTSMRKTNFKKFLDVVNFWSRCDSTVKSYHDKVQNKFLIGNLVIFRLKIYCDLTQALTHLSKFPLPSKGLTAGCHLRA